MQSQIRQSDNYTLKCYEKKDKFVRHKILSFRVNEAVSYTLMYFIYKS